MLVVGVFHPSLALGQAAGSWEHLAGRGGAWSGRGGRAPLQQPMGRGGGGCGAQAGGTLGGTDATRFNLRPRERAAAKLQASGPHRPHPRAGGGIPAQPWEAKVRDLGSGWYAFVFRCVQK